MNTELFNQALEIWALGPQLNKEDYHKSTGFLSNSFIGDWEKCQYSALIKYAGLGVDQGFNQNFAIGHIVESYLFEGDAGYKRQLERYGDECMTKQGKPYKWVTDSLEWAEQIKKQPTIMKVLHHKDGLYHQVLTFDLHGFSWRGEADYFNPTLQLEIDLKTTTDNFHDKSYNPNNKMKDLTFIDSWNYHRQRAVYQHGIKQQFDCDVTPRILAVSKKTKSVRMFTWKNYQERLNYEIDKLKSTCNDIAMVLSGDVEPTQCEMCDQCVTDEIINFEIDVAEYCSQDWRY
jgi:hypothetical protein